MKTNKRIYLTLFLWSAALIVSAQDAIDKYFEEYADNPDFTTIVISSKMFELFANLDSDNPENKDVMQAISGLKGIRIIAFDAAEDGATAGELTNYKSAIKKVGKEYELLMSVDDKDEKVRFFILEKGDKINELFMIVGGEGKLFMMSIVGDIDLEKMSSLSKNMNIGGMNYLENLDESKEK